MSGITPGVRGGGIELLVFRDQLRAALLPDGTAAAKGAGARRDRPAVVPNVCGCAGNDRGAPDHASLLAYSRSQTPGSAPVHASRHREWRLPALRYRCASRLLGTLL
ncbi:MAG: hypothetical protein VYC42_06745 [Pseudomonadota bacterium]|nr:hypothetical protein [Pseudomonadota bacterium]